MGIEELVAGFTDDLEPLRRLALRLADDGVHEEPNGAVGLSPRPKIGTNAYAMFVFPPVTVSLIDGYAQRFSVAIPPSYGSLLSQLNGLDAFELSLFGLPPSMLLDPPRLSRSAVQPLDLATANKTWKINYKPAKSLFHFGSGPFSSDEFLGYFMTETGEIKAFRKGGAIFSTWGSIRSFLLDELSRAEAEYPRHEEFMANIRDLRNQ